MNRETRRDWNSLAMAWMASLTALVATLATPIALYAHAFPAAESPRVGATVAKSPSHVVITFDSPIEKLFCNLTVTDSDGRDIARGQPTVSEQTRQLSISLPPLKPGRYTVHWSVVAEDSHRTEGTYCFNVSRQAP
jgi:methionine-rich copper-binding protein CopC